MYLLRPDIDIRVDGTWVRSVVAWGDLSYGHAWPHGCDQATFTITSKYGVRPRVIRSGAITEILWSGLVVHAGVLDEPDWNGNEAQLNVNGLHILGDRYDALDGSGNATDNPTTAITAAQGRGEGLPWRIGAGVPNAALGAGTTEPLNRIAALMDAEADAAGKRWGVDAARYVFMADDASTPYYHVPAGVADLGVAGDTHFSHVLLRYVRSSDSTYQTAWYPDPASPPNAYERRYGHSEFDRDVTDWGPMAQATAEALAQQVYTLSAGRPSFGNGIEVPYGKLLNRGWRAVHPASVRENRMVRLYGAPDEVTGVPYTDFVIGQTGYKHGEKTVTLNPVGKAADNPEAVLAELYEQQASKWQAAY